MNKNVEKSLQLAKDKRAKVKKRECYYNAFKAVQYVPDYAQADYVEGIAVFGGLVIEHGWIECNGEVIDPTLPTQDIVYFPGLRCEGQYGIAKLMQATTTPVRLPFFYAFGWGGKDHAGFREARRLAMAHSDTAIAKSDEKMLSL